MDLGKLLGSQTAASALLFLGRYSEGTASEIASIFKISRAQVYIQLTKLENAGVLSSRGIGNTKLFYFNTRSPVRAELRALLEKYIETKMPMERYKDFYLLRRRPRSKGKPLGGAYER